jgi:rhodanese-related sulfurtransferase
MKTINGHELKEQIDSGKTLIVEGLPEKYYRSGHIPNALNLPFDSLEGLAAKVLPDRAAPVVVYCGSSTCKTLPLAVYLGGKADWKKLGFPLVKGGNIL